MVFYSSLTEIYHVFHIGLHGTLTHLKYSDLFYHSDNNVPFAILKVVYVVVIFPGLSTEPNSNKYDLLS